MATMNTYTESTPRLVLEAINAMNADGLGIHSVLDVEASARGDVLRAETVVQPGGGGGPLHRHRFQEERFEILEGEIIGLIGRSRLRVRAGETFFVPRDAPHSFTVEADEPARFVTVFRPGLRLAEFFAQLSGSPTMARSTPRVASPRCRPRYWRARSRRSSSICRGSRHRSSRRSRGRWPRSAAGVATPRIPPA